MIVAEQCREIETEIIATNVSKNVLPVNLILRAVDEEMFYCKDSIVIASDTPGFV